MNDEVVLYIEWDGEYFGGSVEEGLRDKPRLAHVYLAARENLPEIWGDDWNDAPWWCNASKPYIEQAKRAGIQIRELDVFWGKPWPV